MARLPHVVAAAVTHDERFAPGWVPARPAGRPGEARRDSGRDERRDVGGDVGGEVGTEEDATAARVALSAAMAAYTAAHGHPLAPGEGEAPRRVRVAVGVRVAVAAVVALVLVVGVVAVRAWQRPPSAGVPAVGTGSAPGLDAPAADGDGGAPAGSAGSGVSEGSEGSDRSEGSDGTGGGAGAAVVVHVVGEVASPGVVTLEAGARVADAVAAAGGATGAADLAAINLARVLTDGEQVVVPAPGQAGAGAPGAGAASAGAAGGTGRVDLNRADAAAFDTLPGIGPVLAERIVAWRDEHGRFTAVEELTEVTGIGPALLAGVRDLVEVG
ncbi:hypothetical protein AFE02nite_02660 [Actinotalea fermentans]|uniref:Helix-hairpin-helix DNA-binding motif class 1 domain-containing protein n=1 Tax=Actinotalea fermentans TaxID=43671 RepID=A0A511YTL4_9CELL|nr:hypothetical protein AFE02nite_02660 [Actinotalea fermentans]